MRLRLALTWLGLLLGSSFVFRLWLVAQVAHEPIVTARELAMALIAGALNDLAAGVLVSSPLLLLLYARRFAGPGWARLTAAAFFILAFVQIIVLFMETFFWIDFGSRLNRYVMDYLPYPREVVRFLEDQLSLSLLVVPLLALAWVVSRPWRTRLRDALATPPPARERLCALAVVMCTLVLVEPISETGPLRPSMLRRINVIAGNGYLGVAYALAQSPERWAGVYPDIDDHAAVAGVERLLGEPAVVFDDAAFDDDVAPQPPPPFRHVVLVIEESFGGAFWSNATLRERYMPRFAALARDGVLFDDAYATGTRTTRGMEAILHGFPPLPGISTTRRTGFESLPSLPRALYEHGFHTVFVYGGWPGFTDFERYWRTIGFEDVLTRFDFEDRWFETSWGVADEILFERILAEMDARTASNRNVFLATLTVSNHRPFDFPEGRLDVPSNARRREYAVAYADWALTEFIERARERPWFDDTLFVLTADHGPKVTGDAFVPVSDYAVPLLFYAPKRLEPERDRRVASTTSIAPTVLGLFGIADHEHFLAQNLMDAHGHYQGFAPVEHDYMMGLLADDHLVVLPPRQPPLGWLRERDHFRSEKPDPEQVELAAALFRSAYQMFYDRPHVRIASADHESTPGVLLGQLSESDHRVPYAVRIGFYDR